MAHNTYYIYALKDPRKSPARAFYIGKGTGTRAHDHIVSPDKTSKGLRILEINQAGHQAVVSILADELTEIQALKLEAELISAFGTEHTGGILTNSVLPSGKSKKPRETLIIPSGAREKSHIGLNLLKEAVLELAKTNPDGVTNADTSKALGLQSDYKGGSKDYLAWSILGILMREGRLTRVNRGKKGFHVAQVK